MFQLFPLGPGSFSSAECNERATSRGKVLARHHCLIRTPSKAKALQGKGDDEREREVSVLGKEFGKAGQPWETTAKMENSEKKNPAAVPGGYV